VTIDGESWDNPKEFYLYVLLTDPQHPEIRPRFVTRCNDDGSFDFKTYLSGDGVPVGKYVVTFVQLHPKNPRVRQFGPARLYIGPDGLKNLYNDPEKNKDISEFVVSVQEPGRDDYKFDLKVAGRDPAAPGRYATTKLAAL
jgi:hypothetical protein